MPATTDNENSQVHIGADGTVYIADVGTTGPTTEVSALDAAFAPVGLITEDGLSIQDSKNVNEKGAWQSRYAVKRWVTTRGFSISFTLEQINWLTWPFAMGGGNLTEPTLGHFKYEPPEPSELDERSMVIDWEEDVFHYRMWIPMGIVTENVEFNVQAGDTIMLPIAFGAIFDGTNKIYTFFTDDPAFDESSL